jgi:putative transposase
VLNKILAILGDSHFRVYHEARNRNPQRWSQGIRNWKLEDQVWLNPERIQPEALKQAA